MGRPPWSARDALVPLQDSTHQQVQGHQSATPLVTILRCPSKRTWRGQSSLRFQPPRRKHLPVNAAPLTGLAVSPAPTNLRPPASALVTALLLCGAGNPAAGSPLGSRLSRRLHEPASEPDSGARTGVPAGPSVCPILPRSLERPPFADARHHHHRRRHLRTLRRLLPRQRRPRAHDRRIPPAPRRRHPD